MKLLVKKGATSYLAAVFIQDSSSTTGAGLSGLTSASSGLICYRARSDDGNAAGTAITLSAGTRGTWSSGGFVEKDATNMKGVYELGIPNAAIATGSNWCILSLSGATNMAPLMLEVQLVDFDPQNSNLGLSNVTANATQFAGQTISAAAGVTIPSSIASPTNITAGTITTVTNLTNAPTAGDLTSTMKTSVTTAATAATPTAAAVTGAVGTVTGAVGSVTGNVGGSVASVTAGVTVTTNNDKTGYALTSGERTSVADALLDRDMSTGMDSGSPTVRTVRQALRALRNKFTTTGGTLTIFKEDDTASSWTSTLATDGTALPIVSSDPA